MAIYCTQCGTSLPDDAIFCQKCGKQLKTTTDHDEPTRKDVPNQHTQKKSNTNLRIGLGIVLLFVVIVVVAVVYTSIHNNNTTSYNQTASNTSNNTSSNSSNGDPTAEATTIINEFCQDVVNGDYNSAYSLLTKRAQFQYGDVNGMTQVIQGQILGLVPVVGSGPKITGYQISGALLIQGASDTTLNVSAHITWEISVDAPSNTNTTSTGTLSLDNSDGALKISNV